MIHIAELQKNFGNVRAVSNISFDVAKGEVVGLLGPNGAGKTTTMRLLTGFLTPDHGVVEVAGFSVQEKPLEARKCIGYLPENAPLYLDLEVTTYLQYIAALRGVEKNQISKRIRNVIELFELGDVVGRPIGQLSKGFRQRVGLAQALIHDPQVLILDEPTSGLDPNQITDIRQIIRNIGRERTVILSTHIMQEVEATCSRALIINKGELVGQGTLNELMHQGRGKTSYIVSAKVRRAVFAEALQKLSGVTIGEWLSAEGEVEQRVMLTGGNGHDRGEDLFQMAVQSGFPLTELRREKQSLEEVFRELTQ
ncbi:MAG: ATP-binding cassette domain-containing protein [Deltaproteobacteria bacterium]|nr:ATP-binding cassette domain-containing protein [Deltaproteobacteria bacterium]